MEGSDVRFNIKRKGHNCTSIRHRRLYRDSLYIDTQKTKMNKMRGTTRQEGGYNIRK